MKRPSCWRCRMLSSTLFLGRTVGFFVIADRWSSCQRLTSKSRNSVFASWRHTWLGSGDRDLDGLPAKQLSSKRISRLFVAALRAESARLTFDLGFFGAGGGDSAAVDLSSLDGVRGGVSGMCWVVLGTAPFISAAYVDRKTSGARSWSSVHRLWMSTLVATVRRGIGAIEERSKLTRSPIAQTVRCWRGRCVLAGPGCGIA